MRLWVRLPDADDSTLVSIPHADLLPIAVNGRHTRMPKTFAAVVPLSDHLGETLQEAWFDRISDRLLNAEMGELNPHWRDDYRQSRIIIGLCRAGNPEPLVSSSYRMYGVHPDLVFTAIQSIRRAKLGDEYSDVYDENGNLIPQRLDIPDYDPTIPLRRRRPVAPAPVWPDVRRLAPFRRIISRKEVMEDGRILYHNEQLECGHIHQEFLEWNLSSKTAAL